MVYEYLNLPLLVDLLSSLEAARGRVPAPLHPGKPRHGVHLPRQTLARGVALATARSTKP